jgi:ABC-type multidrug transport system fused ATPase/permease subunit
VSTDEVVEGQAQSPADRVEDGEWHVPEVGEVEEVHFEEGREERIDPPTWDDPPSIIVTDACKWYDSRNRGRFRAALPLRPASEPPPGGVMALDHATLEIGDGQSVGIIGNNGAGKSTMLKLIAGVTARRGARSASPAGSPR